MFFYKIGDNCEVAYLYGKINEHHYRSVTPAWYETALKVKYSRDDLSSQMIDLIKDSATTNFIYAYNYAINGMGLIYRDLVTKKNTDYASALKTKEKAGLKNLEKVLDVFRGLDG